MNATTTASGTRWCHCGAGYLSQAVRHGPGASQRTNVLICWSCAYEEPSLYGRSRAERNGGSPFTGRLNRPGKAAPGDWMPGRVPDSLYVPGVRR